MRESLHQVRRVGAPKRAKDLVQRKRRNKGLRGFVHQVRGVGAPKKTKDLVQGKRRNKGLRGFVHQVRRVGTPKRAKDLVQGKRRNKGLRESLHQVRSCGAAHHRNPTPEILHSVLPPARNPSFSQRKKPLYQVHSGFFHILCFFWGCKFKGEAHAVRQRLASLAAPCPRGEARTACTSHAYIGRLGMRTVKVVPLPGMLST